MARHQRDLLKRGLSPQATRRWRIGGWLLIAVALVWAIGSFGPGRGLAMLSAHTSVAAGAVVLAMIVQQRRAERHR